MHHTFNYTVSITCVCRKGMKLMECTCMHAQMHAFENISHVYRLLQGVLRYFHVFSCIFMCSRGELELFSVLEEEDRSCMSTTKVSQLPLRHIKLLGQYFPLCYK